MASSFPIILLLVIVLASQYECAPPDSSASTFDFSKICSTELQAALDPITKFDFTRLIDTPHNARIFCRCWVEYVCKFVLDWLDSLEMRITQLISGQQGVTGTS